MAAGKEHLINPIRITRQAWAAFIGGITLGFLFLVTAPPLQTRLSDSVVTWAFVAFVAFGALGGVLIEMRIVELFAARRRSAVTETRARVEALAGS